MRRTAIAGLMCAALQVSCSSDHNAGTPVQPPSTGIMKLTVVRRSNSQIPSTADSAVVRVWNSGTGFNQTATLPVPAPGSTASLTFSVPSGTGYSVGVIAFKVPQYRFRNAIAAGRADDVTVTASTTTPVAVNVQPWGFDIAGPDTLLSGAAATYTLSVNSGPVTDFFGSSAVIHVLLDTNKTEIYNPTVGRSGNTVALNFNAPTVASDSAVFIQYGVYIDYSAWQFNGISFAADMPSPFVTTRFFRRPVKVPGGSITVSFDKLAHRGRVAP